MWDFKSIYDSIAVYYADVVELVDTQDLGSCDASRGGSSPFIRTKIFRIGNLISLFTLGVRCPNNCMIIQERCLFLHIVVVIRVYQLILCNLRFNNIGYFRGQEKRLLYTILSVRLLSLFSHDDEFEISKLHP